MHANFTLIAGALLLVAVPAAPADSDPLEEVVVSGYRQAPLREADLSLTLLDETSIEAASVVHFEELVPLVPNLNLSGEGSRARYLQLRGVGEREQYEGAPNPSVGFYLDDIDLSGIGGVVTTFDTERMEVLRGPQSARFGSSALAGMIYARSADPGEHRSSRAELTLGDDGLWTAGAAWGGPITTSLDGRISAFRAASDGFRRNAFLGSHTNARDERQVRGKLRGTFGDDGSALLTLLYAEADNGYDAWTVRNDARTQSDRPGRDEQRTVAGSLRIEGVVSDGVQLAAVTSLADTDVLFSFDGDWGNGELWLQYGNYVYDYAYRNPRRRDTLGQEVRLLSTPGGRWFNGSTDWLIGISWRRLRERNDIDSQGVYDDRFEEAWCLPCLTDRQVNSDFESDTLAVFVGTETALSGDWSLSLGLRGEHWQARYADRWADINYPGPPGGSSCSRFDCRPDDTLWGGHLALARGFGESWRAYARIARGFKAGGFNPSLAALQGVAKLGPEFIAYAAESLSNYELGARGEVLDGRLSLDLAVFTMDRNEAQLSQSSQQVDFDPNSFVYVTYNGAASVRGAEASFNWRLDGTWRLHGALGLLASQIGNTEATRAVSPDATGRDLAHAPQWTLNLGASFATPAGWFGRLDLDAADGFYFDISHDQRAGDRRLVNLRLGRSLGDWTLSAWVRNLTDQSYHTRGFWFGNEPPGFEPTLYTRFGDPRSYGLTLSYRNTNG